MIARHDHHLAASAEGRSDRSQDVLRRGERLAQRPLPKLDHVTEQHQPVVSRQRLDQRCARRRLTEDIGAAAHTEMQVGDDQRAQVSRFLCGGVRDRFADRLREHEADVLMNDLELLNVGRSAGAEVRDEALDQFLGRARP